MVVGAAVVVVGADVVVGVALGEGVPAADAKKHWGACSMRGECRTRTYTSMSGAQVSNIDDVVGSNWTCQAKGKADSSCGTCSPVALCTAVGRLDRGKMAWSCKAVAVTKCGKSFT